MPGGGRSSKAVVSAAAYDPGPDPGWLLAAPEPGMAGTAPGTSSAGRSFAGSRASLEAPGPQALGSAWCREVVGVAPDSGGAIPAAVATPGEPGDAVAAPTGSTAGTSDADAAGGRVATVGSDDTPVSASAIGSTKGPEPGTSPDTTGMTVRTAPAAVSATSSAAGEATSLSALDGTCVTAGIEATTGSTEPGRTRKTGDNSPELSPPESDGGDWGAAGGASGAATESAETPASSSWEAPVSALALVAERANHTAAAAPASSTGRKRREARPESRSFFTCNTPQVRRSNRDDEFGNFRHPSHTRNRKSRATARISQYDQLAYYFPGS